ncbi:hypothetical protein [Halovenus salina]|uniref:Major Facilitator Superfamily protein n=2 Tax=Halovenus salina TaxID=1510225 RepID=A0ABD5W0P4_9EURY
MPRNPQFEGPSESTTGPRATVHLLRTKLLRPPLRAFVAFVALFFGVIAAADSYIQPIVVDVLAGLSAPSVSTLAVPEEATLGFVYAGFAVVAAVASYHADTVRAWSGLRAALIAVPAVVAAALVVPVLVPVAALPVFFVMKGGEALSKPLVGQYLNDRTAETERATVLSAASMSYAVVRAPLKPLAGVVADASAPTTAVATLGVVFIAGAGVLFVVTTPVTPAVNTARSAHAED